MVTKEIIEKLKKASHEASLKAWCFYSHYHVGAAILLKNGKIISGFNIESPAYSMTICAERSTIFSAVTQYGYQKGDAVAIAIYAPDDALPASPCGACRQVLADMMEPSTPVYLFGKNNVSRETTVGALVPFFFKEGSLNK